MGNKYSLLWTLTGQNFDIESSVPKAYLYGTMHSSCSEALYHEVLLRSFITQCQHYYGETNLDDLAGRAMVFLKNTPADQFLGRLSSAKKEKATRILQKHTGLDLTTLQYAAPMVIAAIITEKLLTTTSALPLDQVMWNYAKSRHLQLHGIESIHQQEKIFNSIPLKYQEKQLKKLLLNLTKARRDIRRLAEVYRQGEVVKLYHLSKKQLGNTKRILLYERNSFMANKMVEEMNQQAGKLFFSVGAAHLAGDRGILKQLKAKGIILQPLLFQTK